MKIISALAMLFIALPAAAQDADAGQRVFNQCRACHTVEQGGRNGVGPNLHGVFGAKAGTKEGFAFSPPLKNSNIVWDDANMAKYMENPRTFIPGNKMAFVGLPKAQDRINLIAYMRNWAASPAPLPPPPPRCASCRAASSSAPSGLRSRGGPPPRPAGPPGQQCPRSSPPGRGARAAPLAAMLPRADRGRNGH